jgi:hypothetical protein
VLYYIKDKIELFKLYRKIRKVENYYLRKIEEAGRAGKSYDECDVIALQMFSEKRDYEVQIKSILSSALIRRACRLNVPIPDFDDGEKWDGKRKDFLSDIGRREVGKAVRKELKERIDVLIPIITAITGLIGVVIGLIAVIKK